MADDAVRHDTINGNEARCSAQIMSFLLLGRSIDRTSYLAGRQSLLC